MTLLRPPTPGRPDAPEWRAHHLIISDVNMPVLDGIGFLKEVKKHPSYKFTPVIMLTTEAARTRSRKDARRCESLDHQAIPTPGYVGSGLQAGSCLNARRASHGSASPPAHTEQPLILLDVNSMLAAEEVAMLRTDAIRPADRRLPDGTGPLGDP